MGNYGVSQQGGVIKEGLTIELGLVLGDLGAGSRKQGFIAD